MSVTLLFAIVLALAFVGYLLGRANASGLKAAGNSLHSIPPYHGYFVALWC